MYTANHLQILPTFSSPEVWKNKLVIKNASVQIWWYVYTVYSINDDEHPSGEDVGVSSLSAVIFFSVRT